MTKTLVIMFTLLASLSAFAQTLTTRVLQFTNANEQDEARVARSMEMIEEIVNSPVFRQKILAMTYVGNYNRIYKGFTQTNMTREQVLASILKAEENFKGGRPGQIDLFLDMYDEASDVIGYTSVSDKFVHMNRYFHQGYTSVETAGNLFHEWLHKIGHDHSYEYTDRRPDSVPYKLGYLVADMAADIESRGDVLKKEILMESFMAPIEQCTHHHE